MTSLELDTEITPMGPAGAIVLSDAEVDTLGGGRRAAVVVRIGGAETRERRAEQSATMLREGRTRS